MARKASGGVSKSDLIRKYHAENPEAGPTEIAKLILTNHKLEVSPPMVSTVLSQDKTRGGKPGKRGRPKKNAGTSKGPGRPAAAKKSSGGESGVSLETLIRAKKLTAEFGGIEQAKAAIDALAKILG